jgi:hypothetical protein
MPARSGGVKLRLPDHNKANRLDRRVFGSDWEPAKGEIIAKKLEGAEVGALAEAPGSRPPEGPADA